MPLQKQVVFQSRIKFSCIVKGKNCLEKIKTMSLLCLENGFYCVRVGLSILPGTTLSWDV